MKMSGLNWLLIFSKNHKTKEMELKLISHYYGSDLRIRVGRLSSRNL